jgi:hypothetical protein
MNDPDTKITVEVRGLRSTFQNGQWSGDDEFTSLVLKSFMPPINRHSMASEIVAATLQSFGHGDIVETQLAEIQEGDGIA